jgi:hypothetical protein
MKGGSSSTNTSLIWLCIPGCGSIFLRFTLNSLNVATPIYPTIQTSKNRQIKQKKPAEKVYKIYILDPIPRHIEEKPPYRYYGDYKTEQIIIWIWVWFDKKNHTHNLNL